LTSSQRLVIYSPSRKASWKQHHHAALLQGL
jgi:hypothetical protein